MAMYLNEVWLHQPDAAKLKSFITAFAKLKTEPSALGLPDDFRLVAGPWFSNEEAKAVFVFEIDNIDVTFPVFADLMGNEMLARRRLSPVVEWSAAEDWASRS